MKKEIELKSLLDKIQLDINNLYKIATHDQKTKLYNHIFFKELLEFEIEKAKRGKPLSIIGIDIDFFKKINDTYGHIQADKILIQLAKILKTKIRKYDIASRFGGEEFFIMLPNTKIPKAKKTAERLRKSVETDPTLKKYKVTISLGVAEYKQRDNFEKICKRADKALYQAKKEGRNKVCVCE